MENELEEKLGAILSNPEMMSAIQSMAQSLSQGESKQKEGPQTPDIDLSMLKKISALAGQSGIDQNQQNLLAALSPYLNQVKVTKLENAMRAAKMARLASGFLGNGGLKLFSGR